MNSFDTERVSLLISNSHIQKLKDRKSLAKGNWKSLAAIFVVTVIGLTCARIFYGSSAKITQHLRGAKFIDMRGVGTGQMDEVSQMNFRAGSLGSLVKFKRDEKSGLGLILSSLERNFKTDSNNDKKIGEEICRLLKSFVGARESKTQKNKFFRKHWSKVTSEISQHKDFEIINLGAIAATKPANRKNSLLYLPKCSELSLFSQAKNSLKDFLGLNRICLDDRQHKLVYGSVQKKVFAADKKFFRTLSKILTRETRSIESYEKIQSFLDSEPSNQGLRFLDIFHKSKILLLTQDLIEKRFLGLIEKLITLWAYSPDTSLPKLLDIYSHTLPQLN